MERMNKEQFIEELKNINIDITEEQLQKLDHFYKLLIEWNNKINLTRITEEQEVYLKHFYDSLTIKRVIDLNSTETLCDVGTGAGFPGIVLKIMYPNLKITLVDALQKRVNYLNEIINELELKDIKAIHVRGEDLKEKYDVVTARAVANIEKLLTYTMHLLNKEGKLIAMKGNIDEEITQEVKNRIEKKYIIERIEQFNLPIENSNRSLVVISNKK
ncbi:MAG: 16S rRNA (guanine(527)-N(7))-methyltransferase RsmG [Bacilli bacterium]|nr:16S rRNA (guanine(527)-N(7))-methyltransferase RsmG [Bacilli bacterium]